MSIGIDVTLDPSNVVSGSNQVDKALDNIVTSSNDATKGVNSLNTAMVDSLEKQKRAAEQMIANAQATKATAQAQSRLIASMSTLDSSTAASNRRQEEQQRIRSELIRANQLETEGSQRLAAVTSSLANAQQQGVQSTRQLNEAAKAAAALQAEQARQQAAAAKEAEKAAQVLQREKQALDNANTSNQNFIRSLNQQVQIARASGVEADKLRNSFKLGATATERQRYEVEKLTEQLHRLNNAQNNASGAATNPLSGLIAAGKAFIALQVTQKVMEWGKAFVKVADDINLLQMRINLYTESQRETNQIFLELTTAANKAGMSIQETANSFSQFALAGKDMGLANNQVVKLISNLQTMSSVSGASGQAASAAIYQLTQAFSAGTLQGQEYKAVALQLPIVLDTLSKKLGITRNELKIMSSEGKINQDVLRLLAGDFADLDAQAAKLPRTVEQASTALSNNLAVAADALNDKLGISQGIAKSIDQMNQALEMMTKKLSGSYTEMDELNKQLGIQAMLLAKTQQAYDDTSDKTGRYAKYLENQIVIQRQAIAETQKQISGMIALGNTASQLAADLKAAQAGPVKPREDADAAKQIKTLQDNVAYNKAIAASEYEKAAAIKLGTNASKEQIATYAAAIKEQTEWKESVKQATKATKDHNAELARQAKQLERNQEANAKYLKTLNDKVTAGNFDVQRSKEQVAMSMQLGLTVDELSASYYKSVQAQNALSLQAKQAEAQSKLNADATKLEKEQVDALVASLYQQEQAQNLAAQVQQIQQDTTNELNPVQGQFDALTQQEAERLTILQEARDADLLSEQQYQELKTSVQRAGEQQRNDITMQNNAMLLSATGDLFGGLADVLKQSQGEQSGIYKAMFAASKAFAIANASVLMWQNISKAMAIGFPQNIPFIAAATAQGVSILGNLSAVAAVGFKDGGPVNGMGTGTSDSINARLSNGEYVMPSRQTRQYRQELAEMRNGTFENSGTQFNVDVANYGNDNVQVQQLDENSIRLIIADEVPRINAQQFGNPNSASSKSLNNNYRMERNL